LTFALKYEETFSSTQYIQKLTFSVRACVRARLIYIEWFI